MVIVSVTFMVAIAWSLGFNNNFHIRQWIWQVYKKIYHRLSLIVICHSHVVLLCDIH